MKALFTVTIVVEHNPNSEWLPGEVVPLPDSYSKVADLPTLANTIQDAIATHLQTVAPDQPLPTFAGTWRVEVST